MYASETTAEQFTRAILNLTDAGQPITSDNVALCFKSHGQCANVNSIPGNSAVILRNDGDTFTIQLFFNKHDPTIVTGWRYEIHTSGIVCRVLAASEVVRGDWPTVTRSIAATVTEWLNASPIPNSNTVRNDVDELVAKLASSLRHVDVEIDPLDVPYAEVYFDDEAETVAEVHINYTYDRYTVYFANASNDITEDNHVTFDELLAGLLAHGARPREQK